MFGKHKSVSSDAGGGVTASAGALVSDEMEADGSACAFSQCFHTAVYLGRPHGNRDDVAGVARSPEGELTVQ